MLKLLCYIKDWFCPTDADGNKYKRTGKKAIYKDNVWDLWTKCDSRSSEDYILLNTRMANSCVFVKAKYILPKETKIISL